MAKWSGSGNTLTATVERGDYLIKIASEASSKLGKTITYKQLASWNNIKNPDLILDGQKIKCYDPGSSGGSSSSTKSTSDPNVHTFGLSATKDNTLVAAWDWSKKSKTSKYKVEWTYNDGTKTNLWYGQPSENSVDEDDPEASEYSEYQIPAGAIRVRFRMKPIAKNKSNSSALEFSDPGWTSYKYYDKGEKPAAPSNIDVEVVGSKITATVRYTDVDETLTHVQFAFVKNNKESTKETLGAVALSYGVASTTYTGKDDSEYKVCARVKATRKLDGKTYETWSDWSAYTAPCYTKPVAPKEITELRAVSSTEVYLAWTKVSSADSYVIEYAEDKTKFDVSGQTTSVEVQEDSAGVLQNKWYINNLQSGKEYFFRVRSVREGSESDWSPIKSVAIGKKPDAPTTWSASTTVTNQDSVMLYWVHNSVDGSRQSSAKLKLDGIPGHSTPMIITLGSSAINNSYITYTPKKVDLDEQEPTYDCVLKTDIYENGAKLKWSVCTAGVKKYDTAGKDEDGNTVSPGDPVYGPWSTPRNLDFYTTPNLALDIPSIVASENGDVITSFPIRITASATPNNKIQSPTGYQLTIRALDAYETVDNVGNFKMVNVGDEVYSGYHSPDENGDAVYELLPGDLTLENGMQYEIVCMASMSSGLTTESKREFSVSWVAGDFTPDAEITVDFESLTALIRPYCEHRYTEYHIVHAVDIGTAYDPAQLNISQFREPGGTYVEYRLTDLDPVPYIYGEPFKRTVSLTTCQVRIPTGEIVFFGDDDNGNNMYFAKIEHADIVTDVKLAVYRRDYDGGFTEIASGLAGENNTTVTDPHPALDYARYRIVATENDTGHVSYADMPAVPVDGNAAVIQWDEEWTNFDALRDDEPIHPAVSGSMIQLPYNIDVSDSSSPETTLVEYIGRSHPVSYYGTQLGSSSSWNMVIPKDDVDTLYALRRLSRWLGDVYVREPSGSGYWAQVTVSFNQKHNDLTIPISLSIKRVEGGA